MVFDILIKQAMTGREGKTIEQDLSGWWRGDACLCVALMASVTGFRASRTDIWWVYYYANGSGISQVVVVSCMEEKHLVVFC